MLCGSVTMYPDHFNWLNAHVRCHSHCAYLIFFSALNIEGGWHLFGGYNYFVGKFLNSNSFFLNNQFRLELSDPHSNTIQVYNNRQFIVHPQSDQECFSCGCWRVKRSHTLLFKYKINHKITKIVIIHTQRIKEQTQLSYQKLHIIPSAKYENS